MSVTMDANMTATPLPIPAHFAHAQQSFSLKRRRLPHSSFAVPDSPSRLSRSLPPRPPSKGCPPVSRLFPQEPPSAWTPLSQSLIARPPPASLYDPKRPQCFFSQCFTNLGLLGRGSFGEVYKVLSLLDGREYAVKRSVQRFRNGSDRTRCVREARNHERLGPHPHLLTFVAAWEEGERLYIQTELCCTSLLIQAENMPTAPDEVTVWGYLCDLLSALRHLHANGFTHMDLKPANVFLTRSGRLKLGDFGLLLENKGRRRGKRGDGERDETGESGRDRDDMQEGDPRYMAPELLRGEYGPPADVFSLGVSILELACSMEVPKGGEGWQQLRQGILPSEFTNGLSVELQRVLRLMLTSDPEARPSVEQLLALPSVRKHTWRRHAHLLLTESLQTLFSLSQSVVALGWGLLSSLRLPFLPSRRDPPAPCTPPRDSWEKDGDLSTLPPSPPTPPSGESLCLGEESVFMPDPFCLDDSPDRLPSRMAFDSTSTPMSGSASTSASPPSLRSDGSPLILRTRPQSRDWRSTLAHTPPSSRARCRTRPRCSLLAPTLLAPDDDDADDVTSSVINNNNNGSPGLGRLPGNCSSRLSASARAALVQNSPPHTPASSHSRSHTRPSCCREEDWTSGENFKQSFEPKNLLTMFDEAV
ncbi:membrane-associated tyrosine- and threonine-specific cdc2-inhibitory kinase [Engraulis encrasicolus]|uniref:membrane-associated tyrosine- and threonine-specific cdc2-inhibitory kinase n=1 Tax=Engraulis encrasicolus TaxID=184585 RepID=UPI002FD77F9D